MSIVASLVGPVTGLLDKFIEDKDQKNALAHEIATMSEQHHQELMKGQLEINKIETVKTPVKLNIEIVNNELRISDSFS